MNGQKYLISPDGWFVAPDGKQYSAVWGTTIIIDDTILGVKTNKNSSNWFAKVGTDDNHVIIAGCQIHYAVRCESRPVGSDIEDYKVLEGGVVPYTRPTLIYFTE